MSRGNDRAPGSENTRLVRDVLRDGLDGIPEGVRAVLDGLAPDDLTWRPAPDANSIGWLLWHLLRQQDVQLAEIAGEEPVWGTGGWRERFDLPYADDEMGYGQDPQDVGRFHLVDPDLLIGYADAVADLSRRLVDRLGPEDYDRVVDDSWDPPVTVGVRFYSVLEDAAKHLGQAEYLAGLRG